MSLFVPNGSGAVIARAVDAEKVGGSSSDRARVLVGADIATLEEGDVAAVAPRTPHAFAADGWSADPLILIAPGIECFEHFRLLDRVRTGKAALQELLDSQELHDDHFVDRPEWQRDRTAVRDGRPA
ncbi:hypothetical protein AB0I10_35330 [Streptomyces sp. NPDC050636]|uniref:hypothetical protein n=1 Tax=Streptomyces sp. NPDC050636 TaxID=3154510 RepID=UPI0034432339